MKVTFIDLRKYVYSDNSNVGTGTLKNHLLSAHPDKYLEDPEPAQEQFVMRRINTLEFD